jgi:hypothetical protein
MEGVEVTMPIPALPTPYVRVKTLELDDEASFAGAVQFTFNGATNKWTFGLASIHANQLDAVATAIERLYQQDFESLSSELETINVDAVYDVDGVTVLQAAFSVKLNQVNDAPGTFDISNAVSNTPGLAWSLRTAIRVNLGVGTPFVP